MRSPPDLGQFLADVDASVVAVGPRELIRLRRLIASRTRWPAEELRAAVASLLARNPREWQEIAARFDRIVGSAGTIDVSSPTWPVLPALVPEVPPRQPWWRRWSRRLWSPAVWLSLLALLVVGAAGGIVWLVEPSPPPPPAADAGTSPPPGPDAGPSPGPGADAGVLERSCQLRQEPAAIERSVTGAWKPPRPAGWLARWLTLSAVSAGLLVVALRWLLLPAFLRRAASRERERLIDAAIAEGVVLRPTYHVPEVLPVGREVIEDAAALLGRVFRFYPGHDVDVPETIRRTVDQAGRWDPAFHPRRDRSELVILSDVNEAIWIGFWSAIVNAWQRLGVDVAPYRFRSTLAAIDSWRGADRLDLEGLRRRHEGAALIVFSSFAAGLAPLGKDTSDWVGELSDWPLVAWVDPDPRPEQERGYLGRRVALDLTEAGLVRFSLDGAGLLSLARWLVAGGVGVSPAAREPLAAAGDPVVEPALRRWAAAASLVPDASWDQLEELRRRLTGVAGAIPDARYLQRLWEWVSGRLGRDEPPRPQDTLSIPLALGTAILDELPDRDRDARDPAGLSGQVIRLLLEQLGPSTEGDDPLQRLRWQLTHDRHQAALDPARARALLAPFAGSAVEDELVAHVEAGLERGTWAEGAPELRALCGKDGVVTLRALAGGPGRLWVRAAALALVPAGFLVAAGIALDRWPGLVDAFTPPAQGRELRFPRIDVCERLERRRWPGTADRPEMVEIPPGTFTMGSPAGEPDHNDDEVQHEVVLTRRFAMSVTEVTQGQYQAVMGANPSTEPDCRDYGVDPNHPVFCVDFRQAVEYSNRLSTKEGWTPCYSLDGDSGVRWADPACTGYRLPTEAEWEYAARAGERWRYAGSDDPETVAWFSDNGGGKTHPVGTKNPNAWGLHDMSGNVWEWVWDWYRDYPTAAQSDPSGPGTGSVRVFRGGSFFLPARSLRVAYRGWGGPSNRGGGLGFRLSRSL